MILGDPTSSSHAESLGRITLDELFSRAAARRPDATALVDPASRSSLIIGPPPRRLSYAEADRMVSAIAARLRALLPADTVVGIQMPQTIDAILAILGVLRAGLIAAPLPLLWRRADLVTALGRAGAKALVAGRRNGGFDYAQSALHVAAEVFSVRYVCGFGGDLPDGMVALDDMSAAADAEALPPLDRDGNAAAHLAAITFEMSEHGPVPVARRHLELLAGGLGVLLESGIAANTAILSTMVPASFAGLCLTMVPWLLSGGTLVLHKPFDAEIFTRQWRDEKCSKLVLPGPVAFSLAQIAALPTPATIIATWRAPERVADSPDWTQFGAPLIDVSLFGEAALVALKRSGDGKPNALPLGPVLAPSIGTDGVTVAEVTVTSKSTIALRGSMVPRHTFPPGIDQSDQPHFAIGENGAVDTGYACRTDLLNNTVKVTGTPAGVVNVGGSRLPLALSRDKIARIDAAATLDVAPDLLLGHRLVGTTADPQTMQAALAAAGQNPLLAHAFAAQAAPNEGAGEAAAAVA
ncbi:MAG TPA: class I adenylate-forming enzyme family protein [Xanthobacteraceae bacterium]|jgi:hypothetical protein|nr:class I adenylate-forming enzyme family protein [Xanthobacteraceae bacterium]